MRSNGIEAKVGRNRNSPPKRVRSCRGVRSSCRTSATSAVVGRGPGGRSSSATLGEAGEPFGLEDVGDGDRAERAPLVVQRAADVVDREVLLAQLDDPIAEGIGLGGGMRPLGRGDEEGTFGIPAELVDEDAEAARGVAEAACRLDPREPLDEVGPQRLVLPVGGVGRFGEPAGEVR